MKKFAFVFAILIGIILLPAIAYLVMMQKAYSQMHTIETGIVTKDVYAIKDKWVNIFLVRSDSSFIMIDAGNKKKNIIQGLSELQIKPEEVAAIFLTHSDFDHTNGLPLFPGARVYLSRYEEQMINGETSRFLMVKNKIETGQYQLLDDGQMINFPGVSIKTIHAPGHTPGAMCYLVNDSILFTGDVLKLVDGKAKEFHHYINMDSKTDMQSIRKLSHLQNIRYVITAHHGVSRDFDRVFSGWKGE